MTIMITGANGMLGRHIAAFIGAYGEKIKLISRTDWDITQWLSMEELDALFPNAKAIFHVAAALPNAVPFNDNTQLRILFDANVRSCLNLAQWACFRKVPLIFISGCTVYAEPHAAKITEHSELVVNGLGGFYGFSKKLAESLFEHYVAQGLKLITLRPSSIYGFGLADDKLISMFLNKAVLKQTLSVTQPENQVNLIHAADVARGAWLAYQKSSWGVFNLRGQNYSMREIAETATVLFGGTVECTDSAESPSIRFDIDDTKAKLAFGFQSKIDLRLGLQLMHAMKELPC